MDIAAWLEGLGLGQYEQAFRDNEIDERVLPSLTAEDLKDLGIVSVGHRRKLLDAIAALRDRDPAPQERASPRARAEAERNALIISSNVRTSSPAIQVVIPTLGEHRFWDCQNWRLFAMNAALARMKNL